MKLAVITTLTFATAGNSALIAHQAPQQKPLVLSAVGEDHRRESVSAFFGDTLCPCIGFDNINGETTVTFDEDKTVAYPADLGSRCEPWDDRRHPTSCAEKDQEPGLGKGWCKTKWCYVDPCNCNLDVLPKVSDYIPDARYRGKPLFYSYATCGNPDGFTEKVPQVGSPGCRCIGFDNIPGTTEISFDGKTYEYPAEIGGSCRAWDDVTHPECNGKKPPSWCRAHWCYVDPCSCNLKGGVVPKISAYLPKASFTGKGLYYSYETCHSPDTWTEKGNPQACVNQETKDECDTNDRCTWTGTRCLGNELVDHPLCEGVAELHAKSKSGASQLSPRAALAIAAVLALVGQSTSLGTVF